METGAAPDRPPDPSGQADRSSDRGPRAAGGRLARLRSLADRGRRDPFVVLYAILVAAFLLRFAWLNVPSHGVIFDEAYYVNAARIIVGLPAGSHYADSVPGLDPNTEHPPLGKLLIAASITIFGDNGYGWRIPSVIAGLLALIAVYRIIRATDARARLAILVVGILALENLTLVHGRIGTLDMLALAPTLTAAWLALQRRWIVAGLVMAVALLTKLTAIYGLGAVLLYVLLTEGPDWWRRRRIDLRSLAGPTAFVAVTAIVAIVGLWLLDARFTKFASPFDHIARMVSYGAGLEASPSSDVCPEADSRPWQWLFNECQIVYYRTVTTIRSGEEIVASVARIDFRGAINPVLIGALPLAALFTGWYAFRTRNRLAIWTIAWAAANYLPYVALAILANRITYIYYMLPLVPALAVAVALLLLRGGLPRAVRWGFLAAYVLVFVAYFPFRAIP